MTTCHPERSEGSDSGVVERDPSASPQDDSGFEYVADVDRLPERGLLGVKTPGGRHVCLFRLNGAIGALDDNCTHADFAMSDGELRGDGTIECVWHGARFDCRTGAVRKGPADEPLPVYDVKIEEGKVYVRPVRRPAR